MPNAPRSIRRTGRRQFDQRQGAIFFILNIFDRLQRFG
jgi:hypothetical protein